jgi:threonine/homoserine/homoserine lactone efflux protein
MVADAVGSLLSLSMAIATSPLPIIGAVLVAGSGRAAGLAFALGWLIGLTAIALLSAFLLRWIGEVGPTGQLLLYLLRVALGVLLLWAALRKWQKRPREGEEPTVPKWLEAFRTMDVPGALRWGAVLAAVNPKHIGLMLAAMAYVAEAASIGEALIAVAVLVLLSSVAVVGIVLARALGGKGAEAGLQAIQRFMVHNSNVIVMIVFIILGAMLLGSGLYGLLG